MNNVLESSEVAEYVQFLLDLGPHILFGRNLLIRSAEVVQMLLTLAFSPHAALQVCYKCPDSSEW